MTKKLKYLLTGIVLAIAGAFFYQLSASNNSITELQQSDSLYFEDTSTVKAEGPQFKLKDDPTYPEGDLKPVQGIQLKQPSNLRSDVEYDGNTRQYIFTNKIGTINYRRPTYMSVEEFNKYEMRRIVKDYWEAQANGGKSNNQRGFKSSFTIGSQAMDKIFGGSTISIVPQGQAELIFGVDINTTENPSLAENMRTTTSFDFEEKIQMNITGTIGERLKLGINYNTEATFEFENKTKLDYTGEEDDILKKVEAGDVNLPLPGTLIPGSQSLFGIKTEMQFGKLNVVTVLSQQRGQSQEVTVQGGAQVSEFEINIDDYDANRHFFLAHSFKDKYDPAHDYLPRLATGITITKIEVWVTNKKSDMKDARSMVAFVDLGEGNPGDMVNPTKWAPNGASYADNSNNTLYHDINVHVHDGDTLNLNNGEYENLQLAYPLTENDYTIDRTLGYISLRSALNASERLAVAYEYQLNGVTYKVGEFSSDDPSKKPLVVKLIKGTNLSPRTKTWDLMMKNIYSLGAYELSNEDFYLNVMYRDDKNGTDVNYLPIKTLVETPIIRILNLDKINSQGQEIPDGVFDFIDRVTIDQKNGRIIFPMREPFGSYMDTFLVQKNINNPAERAPYLFTELYDSTQTKARLVAEKNKYKLKGTYKSSSSSEIYLNAMNVPQGSVKVSSGGMPLTENQDYVVDYTLGTVKIINPAIMESGQPVKVSLENNSTFNMQTKTLVGTHLDYKFSDDFNIGATFMHLNERPLTKKVNIGEEPISNTMWGLNTTYRTNSQFLTTLIDKIPLIQTKEPSTITLTGEFAQLIPGSSSAIGKNGVAYIDDFEASETKNDIRSVVGWTLASTPQRFPEARLFDSLAYGKNRAKLAWYTIDPVFYRSNGPVKGDQYLKNHKSREVFEKEIYPNRYTPSNEPNYLQVLNLSYFPEEYGPYNYDTQNGVNNETLSNPETRWGGIMKQIYNPDFEASNIEYVELWIMDPFLEKEDENNTGGDLYFDLGDISEDILRDGKMAFEQGLPGPKDKANDYITTKWGHVSNKMMLTQAFVNENGARELQDVGLDGLNDAAEKDFFPLTGDPKDPSHDNFKYYRDKTYNDNGVNDIVERYKDFNGTDHNSPEGSSLQTNYTTPDMEDINEDNTLDYLENYYEYHVSLRKEDLKKGTNFVVDQSSDYSVSGNQKPSRWYQLKIPISDFESKFGEIDGFKSIRFIRMYMTGFSQPITVRFAAINFVRSEWRKYTNSLQSGGEMTSEQPSSTSGDFDVQSVNIEENKNYVLPPGIDRTVDPNETQYRALNEQSMVLRVDDLNGNNGRAVFKTVNLDMRQYKRLKMFVHAEEYNDKPLNNGEVSVFIRMGSDFKNNYYEYELPLKVSKSNSKVVEEVWPVENNIDIDLFLFQQLKQARNDAGISLLSVYPMMDGNARMSICGNPTLSSIKSIMIGIRNTTSSPKSAEVWVNELRLTDFSDEGGWAANARAQFKLADFGNFKASGSTMQPGFGSIEKKVNDREKVVTNQYDLATDLELGKFFPEKAQVKIPLYASYSEIRIKPKYNPLDPDIPLEAALKNAKNKTIRDSIERIAIDRTVRRSISLTNMKVNKASKTPMPYDPANFSFTLEYNDQKASNYAVEYNNRYHYEGSFVYLFNNRPKNIAPFAKSKMFNPKPLRILKDFNFYYAPTSIGFRTNMARDIRYSKLRNLTKYQQDIPENLEHDFDWYRIYDVKYDLSRAIKVDFSAKNNSKIDVWYPQMGIFSELDSFTKEIYRYDVWSNIKRGGRTTTYNQQLKVTYNVPINKLPLLDWLTMNTVYQANFDWQYRTPIKKSKDSIFNAGNTIKNLRTIQVNGTMNFSMLYNKVDFIRDLQENNKRSGKDKDQNKEMKTVRFEKSYSSLPAGVPKSISHKLGSEDVTIKVKDADGKEVKGTMEVNSINRLTFTPETDVKNASVVVEGKVEASPNPLLIIARTTVRILTGVKSINITYSQNDATILDGYLPKTYILGSEYFHSKDAFAPGINFLLGSQSSRNILEMNHNGWLAYNEKIVAGGFIQSTSKSLNIKINFEPFRGLRIDISGSRQKSESYNSQYLLDGMRSDMYYLERFSYPIESGNFSMSVMSFQSFEKLEDDFSSKVFARFLDKRVVVMNNLISELQKNPNYINNVDTTGKEGLDINSQQVLIPTFLSEYGRYTYQNAIDAGLFPDYKYIRPNWRVSYDGLSEIPIVQEYFQSITLNHSYSSTYSVGGYLTNSLYNDRETGISMNRNVAGFYVPKYDVSSVSIQEQFSPLVGIDMSWKNNLTTRFEYKKSRMVALGLKNFSINDARSTEYVIGVGYRFPDMPLNLIIPGNVPGNIKSDLDLRADVSIRDDVTVLRMLDESMNEQVSEGNRSIKIGFSADYSLSDRLRVRLFYDRMLTEPRLSSSYKTIVTKFGFSIVFTLAQAI